MTYARFDKNAPGFFYTTGECLACTMPELEAPTLLAPLDDENSDTYFVRQPATPEETEMACRAALVYCVSAIRYGGDDAAVIRRLGNRDEYCDHLLPGEPIRVPEDNAVRWQRLLRSSSAPANAKWRDPLTSMMAMIIIHPTSAPGSTPLKHPERVRKRGASLFYDRHA
jgi:hypothetical protein